MPSGVSQSFPKMLKYSLLPQATLKREGGGEEGERCSIEKRKEKKRKEKKRKEKKRKEKKRKEEKEEKNEGMKESKKRVFFLNLCDVGHKVVGNSRGILSNLSTEKKGGELENRGRKKERKKRKKRRRKRGKKRRRKRSLPWVSPNRIKITETSDRHFFVGHHTIT